MWNWPLTDVLFGCLVVESKQFKQAFLNYKPKRNKTLKGLEQFRKQTPFYSIVPLPCRGYFSMPSMGSTLWLLITYPFKLRPPETHFSLLYLCCSASTYQQLQEQAVKASAPNFFQLLNTLILPLSLQLKHYIAVSWTGRCCVAVESIAEGIPAQRLACQSGLCGWKEGRQRKSQNTRGHQHGKAGMLGAANRAEPPVVRGNMCWVY